MYRCTHIRWLWACTAIVFAIAGSALFGVVDSAWADDAASTASQAAEPADGAGDSAGVVDGEPASGAADSAAETDPPVSRAAEPEPEAEPAPEPAAQPESAPEPAAQPELVAEPEPAPASAVAPAPEPAPASAPEPAPSAEPVGAAAPVQTPAAATPVSAPKKAAPAKRVSAADPNTNDSSTGDKVTTGKDRDSARTVADGVYWIVSSKAPKQAVGIAKKKTKAGSAATLMKKATCKAWQKWQFTWKNGYYRIINVNSGKVLAVASKKANAKVVQAKSSTDLSQRWLVVIAANGGYLVKNVWSGKVLNIAGKAKAGTALVAAKQNGASSQGFLLKKARLVDAGSYIAANGADASKALKAASAKAGSQLAVAKKGKAMSQRFYVRNESDGTYSIQSVSSGMFVADAGGKVVLKPWSDSDKSLRWVGAYQRGIVFQNASTGKALAASSGKAVASNPASSANQTWRFASKYLLNAGCYRVKNATGGYLGVKGASYRKAAAIKVKGKSESGSQSFALQRKGSSYRLVNTRTFQAVAVKGGSKKEGASIVQVPKTNKKSQLWKASIARDGSIVFKNAKSGKLLQASGKTGANASQGKASDTAGQKWKLEATKRYSVSGDAKLDRKLAALLADYPTLRSAYKHVRDDFRWASPDTAYRSGKYMSNSKTKRYAKEMLKKKQGSCYCTSSTVMWLARALGYGANVTVGYLHSNIPGVIGAHSWVEVYKGGKTYVCDADCERGLPGYDFYMKPYAKTPAEYHFW